MATVNKIYPFMTKHCSKGEIFSFWVVVSEWNDTITEGLYNGAHEAFLKMKFLLSTLFAGMFLEVLNLFMAAKKCYKLKMLML
jgi:6,7-dimethyl-8-ribityllumazine synthase